MVIGDPLVSRTKPATAATMRKNHYSVALFRKHQLAFQANGIYLEIYLIMKTVIHVFIFLLKLKWEPWPWDLFHAPLIETSDRQFVFH